VTRSRVNRLLPWGGTLARLLLGGVFAVAGALKVAQPDGSVQAVAAYDLLPSALFRPVGYGLPFLELAVAVLLLLGLTTRLAAVLSLLLLAVFIGGVASAWARGLSIDCGCFGGGGQVARGATHYAREIIRDLLLAALAAVLVLRPRTRLALDGAKIEKDESDHYRDQEARV
jgi:uncharacterized membrane protein YphA (DoxX/SURF4 family)